MSVSQATQKALLDKVINQVLIDGTQKLEKLEYLTVSQAQEIAEIIIASILTPHLRRYNKDQLSLFDPEASK